MFKILKNKKGIALAIVIMIFCVVAIIGGVVTTIAVGEVNLSKAVERNTKAYYLARSAVDIVSTQISKEFNHIYNLSYDGDFPTEVELNAYKLAIEEFKNLLGIYGATNTASVTVDIDGETFPVKIKRKTDSLGKECIEVSSTISYEGITASAATKVGKFSINNTSTEVGGEFFSMNDAIYTWQDIVIDQNFSLTAGAAISAGGTITVPNKDTINAQESKERPVPIIYPDSTLPNKSHSRWGENVNITKADNGYYANVYEINKKITWNVNTGANKSDGDVTLVFTKIKKKNDGTSLDIKVTGVNNLFIFIKEVYDGSNCISNTLIDLGNGISIDGESDIPQTYIIVYNDCMQKWRSNSENASKKLMTYNESKTTFTPLDNVIIKNNGIFEAFLYMPGCDVEMKNNGSITGAIFASNFDAKNNLGVTFRHVPIGIGGLFDGYFEENAKTVYYSKMDFTDTPIIWLRNVN